MRCCDCDYRKRCDSKENDITAFAVCALYNEYKQDERMEAKAAEEYRRQLDYDYSAHEDIY